MSVFYNIKLGIIDMVSNIGRTIVTMLGIILGSLSIIVVLAVVEGGRQRSIQWMEERGGVLKFSIYPKWSFDLEERAEVYEKRLTLKDMKLIRKYFPYLQDYSPIISKWIQLKYKDNVYSCRFRGVYPAYQSAQNFYVDKGRFISDFDIISANKVIVIGTGVQENLFGSKPAIGEKINVQNTNFTVVGIMEKKEMYFGAWSRNALEWMNRQAFIPLTTMVKKLYGEEPLHTINFKVASTDLVVPTQEKMIQFLAALRDGDQVFEVRANRERLQDMEEQNQKIQLIVLLIGGISLLVGGIVIANINLASIKERLKEIGIRIAVGAKRRDILVQFIIQAMLVSFIGGIIGVILGLSLLKALSHFLNSPTAANIEMVAIALGLSTSVGLIAGIFPAINASRSNPIQILRYE